MDSVQLLLARKLFRLRVHEAKGAAYQALFERVMEYRYPTFSRIKTYGNAGDRKNDGYIRDTGTFFQVYAPENPDSARSVSTAAKKAKDDFRGMLKEWAHITTVSQYRFVFNDAYRGCPAPVEQVLLSITTAHNVPASALLARHLEDEALLLALDQLLDVIQTPIPTTGLIDSIDFSVLREVIEHVLNMQVAASRDSVLAAPDFGIKIKFNGLSSGVASLLTVGSYQNEAVADYFSTNSTYAKQQLRDFLAAVYRNVTKDFVDVTECDRGDLIFFRILHEVSPGTTRPLYAKAIQDAAIVIMAYFFESCDIFEEPSATA